MPSPTPRSQSTLLSQYKYHLIASLYVLVTGGLAWRIKRQPDSQAVKAEQYETLFKGTTLAAILIAFVAGGKMNKPRSRGVVAEGKAQGG